MSLLVIWIEAASGHSLNMVAAAHWEHYKKAQEATVFMIIGAQASPLVRSGPFVNITRSQLGR